MLWSLWRCFKAQLNITCVDLTHSSSFVQAKPHELNESSAMLASAHLPLANAGVWQRKAMTYFTFSLTFGMRTSNKTIISQGEREDAFRHEKLGHRQKSTQGFHFQPQNGGKLSERWHLKYCLTVPLALWIGGHWELCEIFRPTLTRVRTRLGTEVLNTRVLSSGYPLHSQAFNYFSLSKRLSQPLQLCSASHILTATPQQDVRCLDA